MRYINLLLTLTLSKDTFQGKLTYLTTATRIFTQFSGTGLQTDFISIPGNCVFHQ